MCGPFGMRKMVSNTIVAAFVTDLSREQASIMFWVSKNTNLKEVNVNLRV